MQKTATASHSPLQVFYIGIGLCLLLLIVLWVGIWTSTSAKAQSIPRAEEAFGYTLDNPEPGVFIIDWSIAPDTYLYQKSFTATSTHAGLSLIDIDTPNGQYIDDPTFGRVLTHRDSARSTIKYQLSTDSTQLQEVALQIHYQGCHDSGICYPPSQESEVIQLLPTSTPSSIERIDNGKTRSASTSDSAQHNRSDSDISHLIDPKRTNNQTSDSTLSALGARSDSGNIFRPDIGTTTLDGQPVIQVSIDIASGHYLYQDKLQLASANPNVRFAALDLPAATRQDDITFGEVMVYRDQLFFDTPTINHANQTQVPITLHYQGCAEQGVCFPPDSITTTAQIPDSTNKETTASYNPTPLVQPVSQRAQSSDDTAAATTNLAAPNHLSIAERLIENRYLSLFWFFLAGLLLTFTPCVLPMIPIVSGIILGQGSDLSRGRAFCLSLAYVIGMAVTYTALGVIAGLIGANLQGLFQQPWLLAIMAILFSLFALAMLGVFTLQAPTRLQNRLNRYLHKLGGNLASVFLMGAISAIIVGPCMAPPLAGILSMLTTTGDPLLGGAALFALAMGMGVPLLLVGLSAGSLLPKAGRWMEAIKRFFAILLFAVAIIIAERIIAPHLVLLLWGMLSIFAACLIGVFKRSIASTPLNILRNTLGITLLTIGILQIVGATLGNQDPLKPLANTLSTESTSSHSSLDFSTISSLDEFDTLLKRNNDEQAQPIMIYYTADWCIYCRSIERDVFTDPNVQRHLSSFLLIKADITRTNAKTQGLLTKFNALGPPTIIFTDSTGQKLDSFTLIGRQEPVPFANHLQRLKKQLH